MSGLDVNFRKFLVIGPHCQCGSIAIGSRIMFWASSSPMIVLP